MFTFEIKLGCFSVADEFNDTTFIKIIILSKFCNVALNKLFNIVTRGNNINEFIKNINFALKKINMNVKYPYPMSYIVNMQNNQNNFCSYIHIIEKNMPDSNIVSLCGTLKLNAETVDDLINVVSNILFGLKFDVVKQEVLNLVMHIMYNAGWYIKPIETAIVNLGNLSMLFYDIEPDNNGNKTIKY